MKEKRNKYIFRRSMSLFMAIVLMLTTALSDGDMFFGLVKVDLHLSREAKAAINWNDKLEDVIKDQALLSFLKGLSKADGTGTLTIVQDLQAYSGVLEIPSNVKDITNLGLATKATELDLSRATLLTKIPDKTFPKCQFTKVTLPGTVTEIGANAFENCNKLATIDLSNINTIGVEAFTGCAALTDATYKTIKENLTSLGEGAFKSCAALTEAYVPKIGSQHVVPKELFSGCTKLKKVTFIDEDIQEIGDSAFANTGDLSFLAGTNASGEGEKKLPLSIKSLGVSAFNGSKISSLDLGNTQLTEIKNTCFYNTAELKEITLPNYQTFTKIGFESFRLSGVESITIPNTVTTLGERAFFNALNLEKVVLSQNITTIPKGAFQIAGQGPQGGMSVDADGNLGGTIDINLANKFVVTWNNGTANGTTDGTGVALKSIETVAFNATNLQSLEFLEKTSVETIGAKAFAWTLCSEVMMPSTLKTIGESALAGCRLLKKVEFQGENLTALPDTLFGADKYGEKSGAMCHADVALEEVKLPKSLKSIGKRCFSHCASLKTLYYDQKAEGKIRFPGTLTSIGEEAFSYCGLGKEGDNNVTDVFNQNQTFFGNNAVQTTYIGMTDVEIPDSVTVMGVGAFRNSQMLETLKLGSGLQEIPKSMCRECSYIENKVNDADMTADNLTEYGGLKNVIIPNNVTLIDEGAFAGCMALQDVNGTGILPTSLTEIGREAFKECKSMEQVFFPASLKKIGQSAFADAAQMAKKGESQVQYGGLYELDFTFATALEEIGDTAFARTYVKSVYLPPTLKEIPVNLFQGCYQLRSVSFNPGEVQVEKVGDKAFEDCYSLDTVKLPFTATWGAKLFAGYAGAQKGSITVSPTKDEEDKEIIWGRETDFPFACFTNFPNANLEITDDALEEGNPYKNLYIDGETKDNNKFVEIRKPNDASKNKVKLYGKEIGSARLKVTGTVDLSAVGDNKTPNLNLTISYVYNISVKENPITDITFNSDKITEENGVQTIYLNCDDSREYEIKADFTPEDATEEVKWEISDSTVATITDPVAGKATSTVKIKAGKAGDTVLKAYGKNVSKTINIKVRVPASGITLSEKELTLATGDKQTLVATVKYDSKYEEQAKTYPDTYVFSSDKPEVATVDDKGEVTAVAEGTANITVKCLVSGKTASCRITVKNGYVAVPKTVTISAVTCEMNKGETKTLVASVLPEKADQTLTWTSSNAEIATVEAGVVTALKPGDVTITAQASNNVKAECRIAVKSPVEGMKILSSWGTAKTIYIKKGEEVQLASFHTNDDCTDTLRFKAKDNKVASVSDSGRVVAKKPGKFVVKLQAMNGETLRSSAKITIHIVKKVKKVKKGKKVKKIKTKPIKKITIKGKKKVKVGNKRCLQIKAKPAKTPSQFTWKCNKPNIATVDAYGVVTGLKKGKVKITVKPTKGKKKTITFKVVK